MKATLIFAGSLIIFSICKELQADKFSEKNCIKYKYNNEKINYYPPEMVRVCSLARAASVQSVYVTQDFVHLFISANVLKPWNTEARILSGNAYLEYITESTSNQSGRFMKVGAFGRDGELKEVSASFLHFSDCVHEFGYLISGLSAYQFVIRNGFYLPSGKIKPITDFFEADDQLLVPEDKLKEVVSVSLIKWVEKDKIKDHAIYKIILKTVTRKLVKAYFNVTSQGEVTSLNSEPFVPAVELFEENDEFNLLEESALYYVGEKNKLSMGYQFTSKLAFPIYFDYNQETNTYQEYPMRTENGFNTKLETLGDKPPHWNRYILPTETWLGCPETSFCLGRSFDAVFPYTLEHNAIFENSVYSLKTTTSKPSFFMPLDEYLPRICNVDAAFSLGEMVFLIKDDNVYHMKVTGALDFDYKFTKVFTGIDETSKFSVSAIIALDKGQKSSEVSDKTNELSHLKSARLRRYQRIHKRAAQPRIDNIFRKMVYVYLSTKDGGNVYKYQMQTKDPPKFILVDKKPFKEVNEALPKSVSLVFTAEDKVVTMVNHFMIEQSSQTFFTQTESQAKFTLVDKYFGCQREYLEKKLSKDFVQKYIEFAAPEPGVNVEPDISDVRRIKEPREPTGPPESTSESHCPTPKDSEIESSSTENSDLEWSTSFSENSDKVSSTEETLGNPSVDKDEDRSEVKSSGASAKIAKFIQASVIFILIKFYYN